MKLKKEQNTNQWRLQQEFDGGLPNRAALLGPDGEDAAYIGSQANSSPEGDSIVVLPVEQSNRSPTPSSPDPFDEEGEPSTAPALSAKARGKRPARRPPRDEGVVDPSQHSDEVIELLAPPPSRDLNRLPLTLAITEFILMAIRRHIRAGRLFTKPSHQKIVYELIVAEAREAFPDYIWTVDKLKNKVRVLKERWRQWQWMSRSGTGPDREGIMQAPQEAWDELAARCSGKRWDWMQTQPLGDEELFAEVFDGVLAVGVHAEPAGREGGVPERLPSVPRHDPLREIRRRRPANASDDDDVEEVRPPKRRDRPGRDAEYLGDSMQTAARTLGESTGSSQVSRGTSIIERKLAQEGLTGNAKVAAIAKLVHQPRLANAIEGMSEPKEAISLLTGVPLRE